MKFTLAVLVSVALVSPALAAAVHHYDFNDESAVLDSVGTDDGTLLNGASLTIVSGALTLDGSDDYVQFAAKLVPTSGPFTLTFFAQETSFSGNYAEIISQGSSGGPGFYVGYDPSHNFRIGDNWISPGLGFPNDGLTHHYALVSDGSDARFYIDGGLVLTKGSAYSLGGSDDTRLGRQFSAFSEYFAGHIDELWVFDTALDGSEVASLANLANLPEPGTLALAGIGCVGLIALLRRRVACSRAA